MYPVSTTFDDFGNKRKRPKDPVNDKDKNKKDVDKGKSPSDMPA